MDKEAKRKHTNEGIRLAYLLRHNPEKYGLSIDQEGWVCVKDLLIACDYTQQFLDSLVAADTKGRYTYNADKSKIRALQGHSHPNVRVTYIAVTPPPVLFHGTTMIAYRTIWSEGLNKMERHHVHMTDVESKAVLSALRWKSDNPWLIHIDAKAMAEAGLKFYRSDNGVWLTEHVPSKYLTGYWPPHA